ncbi:hypothetical protein DFH28DRAFT_927218 [Melampsora americana]|nr:hypothetical protein DFH28DRAFT_927218 [Melampsora americana]
MLSSVMNPKPGNITCLANPVKNATETEELDPRKRKIEQAEDEPVQENKPVKRGRKAKGWKRKMCEEKEEVEPAEGKVLKDKPLKRGGKKQGWKGWAIVEVDEEELGKDTDLQEAAQEEADEGNVNVHFAEVKVLKINNTKIIYWASVAYFYGHILTGIYFAAFQKCRMAAKIIAQRVYIRGAQVKSFTVFF